MHNLNQFEEILKRRKDFSVLHQTMHGVPLIYFDSAATAQKPQCVIDAIRNYYEKTCSTVHRSVYQLANHTTEQFQNVREQLHRFLNAKKSCEIIFTRGTTESINLVAASFGKAFIQPGDEILISVLEHHSNIVPWQILCQERKANIKVIPCDERGVLDLSAFKDLLSSKTKLVAVAHISNALGTIHPVREMAAMAHAAGAKVLVDGAQATPHMSIDVQDLDADFYAFSGHKAYGPTGVGVLYGKESLLEKMPPYQGGGDMIKTVSFDGTIYNDLPLKFEAGTPMIAEVLGLGAALRYLSSIGLDKIALWEQQLLKHATARLQEIDGLRILGTAPDKGAILSFTVDGTHPLDIATFLDFKGIAVRSGHHCAQPAMHRFGVNAAVRASFGLYNTLEEIDCFAEALKQVIKQLRR